MSRRVDLLEGNISGALLKLSLPLIGSQMMNMAYNLIDTLWVGKLGTESVTACATAGNWLFFSQGLAMVTQVGVQILVAQRLGEGKLDKARATSRLAIVTMMVTMVLFFASVVLFREQMVGVFGIKSEQITQLTEEYLLITGFGVIFMGFNYVLTGIYTATGDSRTPFIYNSIGIVINIILDPILIFGWIGAPECGVVGAGIATTISQVIVCMIFINHIVRDRYIFGRIEDSSVKVYDFGNAARMLKLGFPPAMQIIIFAVVYMGLGRIMTAFGDVIIGVQRVGSQIESLCFNSAAGFQSAMNAYTAQNYGNGNEERIRQGYSVGLRYMIGLGVFASVLFFFFANPIYSLFLKDEFAVAEGANYLRIMVTSQIFICLEAVAAGAFGGIGKTHIPSALSIIGSLLRIPLALALVAVMGSVSGVWWAISLSSILKGSVIAILFRRQLRKGVFSK